MNKDRLRIYCDNISSEGSTTHQCPRKGVLMLYAGQVVSILDFETDTIIMRNFEALHMDEAAWTKVKLFKVEEIK